VGGASLPMGPVSKMKQADDHWAGNPTERRKHSFLFAGGKEIEDDRIPKNPEGLLSSPGGKATTLGGQVERLSGFAGRCALRVGPPKAFQPANWGPTSEIRKNEGEKGRL